MRLIEDYDIGSVCDVKTCTAQAVYVLVLKISPRFVRLYCPQCTAVFLQSASKVLRANESLHDYVETEHIVKGAGINV